MKPRAFLISAPLTQSKGEISKYKRINPDKSTDTAIVTKVIGRPEQWTVKSGWVKPEYSVDEACAGILGIAVRQAGEVFTYKEIPASKFPQVPSSEDLENWFSEGICPTVEYCCEVEPDCERCEHGLPSWLVALGMI